MAEDVYKRQVVAVAGGVGCSLACFINEKMSKDRTYVNVIMSDDLEEMKRLRDFLAKDVYKRQVQQAFPTM